MLAAAVEHFAGTSGPASILDLGTGPGTLLLAALDDWPRARGVGIDVSEAALSYARRNAARLGLGDRATLQVGDWGSGLDTRFDLILCNPPYVATDAPMGPGVAEFEPAEALFAGADGLDDYRRLAPMIGRLLARGGLAAIEIGYDQQDSAAALFVAAGHAVAIATDLADRPRALDRRLTRLISSARASPKSITTARSGAVSVARARNTFSVLKSRWIRPRSWA